VGDFKIPSIEGRLGSGIFSLKRKKVKPLRIKKTK
jgi:hypothetical protein